MYGKHVTIWTDHLPLQQAFQSENLPLNDPQIHRQITEIGRFTRDVKHVSGQDNVFADFLSRIRNLPDKEKDNVQKYYKSEERRKNSDISHGLRQWIIAKADTTFPELRQTAEGNEVKLK